MFSPIKTLFMYFPLTFFLRILLLISIDAVTAYIAYKLYKKNKIVKNKAIVAVLLVVYISLVLFFTVLGRRTLEYYRFGMDVISYYSGLFNGDVSVDITELLLNVLMFVPMGSLTCVLFSRFKVLWAFVVGMCISLFIEIAQLLLRNGFVSLTDVIHNTLGALLGGVLTFIIVSMVNNIRKRQNQG